MPVPVDHALLSFLAECTLLTMLILFVPSEARMSMLVFRIYCEAHLIDDEVLRVAHHLDSLFSQESLVITPILLATLITEVSYLRGVFLSVSSPSELITICDTLLQGFTRLQSSVFGGGSDV